MNSAKAQTQQIILVIPCYNEAKRLQTEQFISFVNQNRQIIFVNDGSNDSTALLLDKICQGHEYLHSVNLATNQGKAEAVRQGILASVAKFPKASWFGFWDADLATPLEEVEFMLQYQETFYPQKKFAAIWGSRINRLGSDIQRSSFRHYFSRIFVTFMSNILKLKAYDSQCGAKLFRTDSIEAAFGQRFITRWIFDIEILKRIPQSQILEYPVLNWKDIEGSKLKPSDGFKVFWDILRIWKFYDLDQKATKSQLKY